LTASPDPAPAAVCFGVGFDTSRYGHHVTFLRQDLQLACPAFEFQESRTGYNRLLERLTSLAQRAPSVHFHIRLDVAGQYATNLETFLRGLPLAKTLSVGEPARNASYRQALFPKRKADPVESLCAARFALLEKPKPSPDTSVAYELRELVHRLEGQTRQSTRLTNQLHNLLARVFPELALLAADLQAGWVLELLGRYPTAGQIARARLASLTAIPFLTEYKASSLQELARTSVASFHGETAASLVAMLTGQLRDSQAQEESIKGLMATAYQQLAPPNHLDSIPGIGLATAAVLTAKIVTIERFASPAQLVSYFGIFPQEESSGVDKNGGSRRGRQKCMSRKGNDLTRKYLWNAAKAAMRFNPAVRALYGRLLGRGSRRDVALGHCMRKLLHLVFAVWKTGRAFDPAHYPWQGAPNKAVPSGERAAGHKADEGQQRSVVTTAEDSIPAGQTQSQAGTLPTAKESGGGGGGIDYAALRRQASMEAVLATLDWLDKLKGSGPQRRGPCPIHAKADSKDRSFSVNLQMNAFRCFHKRCGAQGNVLDLWVAVRGVPLYEAAGQLANALGIDLSALPRTEKRNP
jgi:transposase